MAMFARLRPLELTMEFEDRSYNLGDTVDIEVELKARRDVVIRAGRVDLICQEYYKQTTTVTYPAHYGRLDPLGKKSSKTMINLDATKGITRTRNETYSHSGALFLTDTPLRAGTTSTYMVRLEIGLEPPEHMLGSALPEREMPWALVAAFDLAQARDATERRPIKVAFARSGFH